MIFSEIFESRTYSYGIWSFHLIEYRWFVFDWLQQNNAKLLSNWQINRFQIYLETVDKTYRMTNSKLRYGLSYVGCGNWINGSTKLLYIRDQKKKKRSRSDRKWSMLVDRKPLKFAYELHELMDWIGQKLFCHVHLHCSTLNGILCSCPLWPISHFVVLN